MFARDSYGDAREAVQRTGRIGGSALTSSGVVNEEVLTLLVGA